MVTSLCAQVQEIVDRSHYDVKALVTAAPLDSIIHEMRESREKRATLRELNIFALVTDQYRHENFHSDVLRALLDPQGDHNEGSRPLHLFLDILRGHGASVNGDHYQNAEVVREEGKIDILIRDQTSKRAIIVENKINHAGDMPRQLPRYLEHVRSLGLKCDAIAYLRLNRYCDPSTHDWTNSERKAVAGVLKVINACDESQNDLLNGWITKCAEIASDPNTRFVFRQYASLIKNVGQNAMNKLVMSKFYALMREGTNYQNAQAIRSMLDGLIQFRQDNIVDTFRSDKAPFHKVGPWSNAVLFTDLFWNGAHLGIDLYVEPDRYNFFFWDRNDKTGAKGHAKAALAQMAHLSSFVPDGCGFSRSFKFPDDEDALMLYLREFRTALSKVTGMPA